MNFEVQNRKSFSLALVLAFSLLVSFSFAPRAFAKATPSWTLLARQVGQSETEKTRDTAIKKLREMKDLNATLLAALETPDRSLALDVISNLQLQEVIPDLLTRISSDEDGFLVLALNSLLNPKNKDRILKAYVDKLAPGHPAVYSPASLVAMLEPLGRLGIPLSKATMSSLFSHDFAEVRMAGLSYVRIMTLQHRNRSYLDFAFKALQSTPLQLRVQALYFIDELAKKPELKTSIDLAALTTTCTKEKGSMKELCQGVMTRAKGVSKS